MYLGTNRDAMVETRERPNQQYRQTGVHGCQIVKLLCGQIVMLFGQIGIKYPRKGNNSVILKDKNSNTFHYLHMAITNIIP